MDDNAAAVLGVGPNPSLAEIEEAYRNRLWDVQSKAKATASLAEWEMQTNAVQRLAAARETLIARLDDHSLPHQPAPAPAPVGCQACGSLPTTALKFQQQIGMLFMARRLTIQGRLCRSCGLALGRQTQNKTLVTGWWGIISFFRNLGIINNNASMLRKAASLPEPRRDPDAVGPMASAPLSPGRPVFARGGVLVAVAALGIAFVVVKAELPHNSETVGWKVEACVESNPSDATLVRPISCAKPHAGTVIAAVPAVNQCPTNSNLHVDVDGTVYCIDLA